MLAAGAAFAESVLLPLDEAEDDVDEVLGVLDESPELEEAGVLAVLLSLGVLSEGLLLSVESAADLLEAVLFL